MHSKCLDSYVCITQVHSCVLFLKTKKNHITQVHYVLPLFRTKKTVQFNHSGVQQVPIIQLTENTSESCKALVRH